MPSFETRLTLALGCAFLALAPATSARADGPQALSESLDPQAIYGGTPVATCGWPTTVSMEGSCTATLVHPQVVVYAAHCGTGYQQIWMGETLNSPKRTLSPEFCKTFQGNQSGTDFAFCKLKEPVLDVPIVPILMGCETDLLQPGQAVTIVGFGNADAQPSYGTKREVVTTINGIENDEAFIGGNGKDSCQGDSGGPVYIQVADGTWRVFGITSYGGECGSGGYYSMMHKGVAWFEQEAGVDITPCHNADGTWQPSQQCKGFPSAPGPGGGDWAMGCGGGPVGAYSSTCGAPADDTPDTAPPTVTIVDPIEGQEFTGDGGAQVKVIVDAMDTGWGMKEVRLVINDKEVPGGVDNFPPYEFPLFMPTGAYCIGANGVDVADNVASATPVCIGVNGPAMPPPPPEPETTTTDDGTSGTSDGGELTEATPTTGEGTSPSAGDGGTLPGGESSGEGPGAGEGDEGCGCRSGHVPEDSLLALAGLGLLGLARRRRG